MNIEAVKVNQAVARVAMRGRYTLAVRRAVEIDLPGAIELIEEMMPLLERARGEVPFGQQWFDDTGAVLAKIRPQTKQEGI